MFVYESDIFRTNEQENFEWIQYKTLTDVSSNLIICDMWDDLAWKQPPEGSSVVSSLTDNKLIDGIYLESEKDAESSSEPIGCRLLQSQVTHTTKLKLDMITKPFCSRIYIYMYPDNQQPETFKLISHSIIISENRPYG